MKKTSIILNSYNPNLFHAQMTMACIAAIKKFTDEEDYELIIVDNAPKDMIRDDYHIWNLDKDKYILSEEDLGVYGAYNAGAEFAEGKYLVFIQSDVFVHEDWLPRLIEAIENGFDYVFPQQIPLTRKQVKSLYTSKQEDIKFGQRDAGMVMFKKDSFWKTGGWDARFKCFGETAMWVNANEAGLQWTDKTGAIITHIMAATNHSKDSKLWNKEQGNDAKLLKKYYGV